MAKPKRIEDARNYCNGCDDYVVPAGAPVVEVSPDAGSWDSSQDAVRLCFRCVKAALDELTRPEEEKQ